MIATEVEDGETVSKRRKLSNDFEPIVDDAEEFVKNEMIAVDEPIVDDSVVIDKTIPVDALINEFEFIMTVLLLFSDKSVTF